MFSSTGKLTGTACTTNQVITQVDDTHLIAEQRRGSQTSSAIVDLAAP